MKWKDVVAFFWKIANSRNSTAEIAWGAAIGTFISVFPTFGFGTPIVLVLSRLLKFNLAIAVAASVISNPFTSPFFMYLNYKVGALILNNPIAFDIDNWKENLADTGLSILIGSFLVSGFMALLAYYFSKFMVERFRNRKKT
ncbi:DUF2062 domain-containing protein [Flavobacterium saliperosum]|uniref:DUF2062 domain-containing protein n=1 Tax=Flavobacterium saliperosum TaxID=329186 RepID=A0A1G4V7A9_9FLAO|nr:DUF2062 domain-containing protein [Flavobacterium saliperosum]SCX02381.1 hypothetical protein SAMN02927925_00499 [Flavobacterium saliperosum]